MIAYLSGTIQKILEKKIILNVSGVGYLITVPAPILATLTEHQSLELYIHTQVREDDISLYGLPSSDAIKFFNQLISIQGIGAKMATDILSLPIDQVKMAIGNSDTVILTSIPGVGKKIADRLIAELKDRIEIAQSAQAYKGGLKKQTEEAIEALLSLGYQRSEILRRLKAAPETLQNSEEVIRYFLTSHA